MDVASPAKPVVARGVAASASAEFARPSSAVSWHERERTAAPVASSSSPPRSTRPRPSTAASAAAAVEPRFRRNVRRPDTLGVAHQARAQEETSPSSSSTARSSSQSARRSHSAWEPERDGIGSSPNRSDDSLVRVGRVSVHRNDPRVATPTSPEPQVRGTGRRRRGRRGGRAPSTPGRAGRRCRSRRYVSEPPRRRPRATGSGDGSARRSLRRRRAALEGRTRVSRGGGEPEADGDAAEAARRPRGSVCSRRESRR